MSGIDQFLAQNYTEEDTHKVAAAELFCKMASENGINLNALSDDQINQLWNETGFGKLAEEGAEDDTKEKVEAAAKEHEEKKEEAKKEAEAVNFGKIAAESFVMHRLQLEKSAAEGGTASRVLGAIKDVATAKGLRAHLSGAKEQRSRAKDLAGRAESLRAQVKHAPPTHGASRDPSRAHESVHDKYKVKKPDVFGSAESFDTSAAAAKRTSNKHLQGAALHGAGYLGGTSAAGTTAYVGGKKLFGKKEEEGGTKKASAIDALAAELAVEKVAHFGLDPQEAAQRINAVLTLGPSESTKIAHVSNLSDAVDVRSSELLELAGYPIDWSNTPFSKEASQSAVNFDIAAGNVAVKMASDMGWNPDYVAFKINELFAAGAEGDPAQSDKVASAQDEDSMLVSRAGELLELCGFEVSWG